MFNMLYKNVRNIVFSLQRPRILIRIACCKTLLLRSKFFTNAVVKPFVKKKFNQINMQCESIHGSC